MHAKYFFHAPRIARNVAGDFHSCVTRDPGVRGGLAVLPVPRRDEEAGMTALYELSPVHQSKTLLSHVYCTSLA